MDVRATRSTLWLTVALLACVPALAAAQATPGGQTSRTAERSPEASDLTAPQDGSRLGAVRGTIVDRSAGVLPGVTVVAAALDGRTLSTTVSNATGEFTFEGLPPGPVDLRFHLSGFGDSKATVTIPPSGTGTAIGEARLVHRLELLAVTETVVVRADPPAEAPAPRPEMAPVPDHDQASVCGPARADAAVPALGTIRSRRNEGTQGLFAAGDELLIEGGTLTGLDVGQNFVVRRRYPTALTYGRNLVVMGEHSSGLLQIVAVEERAATAVVVYACDEMMMGDYLAPFQPEPMRVSDPVGAPTFDTPARILFGDAGQMHGATRRLLVIDRGARHGVQPGQRLSLLRRSRFSNTTPATVGDAVVVAVRADSATIRVERATDVIFFGEGGDWAAPPRPPSKGKDKDKD